MPDSQPRPFRPSDYLGWWPVVSGCIFVIAWAVQGQVNNTNLSNKLTEVQAMISGIRAETSAIPRLVADQANVERRLLAVEKANESQDDRMGRIADSIGSLRGDFQEFRSDVRSITGLRGAPGAPALPPARVPR